MTTKQEVLLTTLKEREEHVNKYTFSLLQQITVALAGVEIYLKKQGDMLEGEEIKWTHVAHIESDGQVYLAGSYKAKRPKIERILDIPVRVSLPYEAALEDDASKVVTFLEDQQKQLELEQDKLVAEWQATLEVASVEADKEVPSPQEFSIADLTEEQQKALKLSQPLVKGKPN